MKKFVIATVNTISGQWDVLPFTFNSTAECAKFWEGYEGKNNHVPVYKLITVDEENNSN